MNNKQLIFINVILFVSCIFYYCLTSNSNNDVITKTVSNTVITNPQNPIVPDNKTPSIEELIESRYKFYDIPLTKTQQITIQDEANKYSLSYELILAIIKVESDFNTNAVSKTNDYGIMQINSPTFIWCASQLGIENADPLDFETNIKCGVYYLNYIRNYWVKYGTPEEYLLMHTVSGYHKGIKGVLDSLENDTYDIEYVNKVIDYKYKLEME